MDTTCIGEVTFKGRPHFLYADGTLLPVVRGGDGSTEPDPPAAPATPPAGYVPQEQVTQIATKEKEAGKRAAEKAIAEQLGVSIEDAARIVKEATEREEAQATEAQKAQKRAEQAEAKATEREAAAAKKEHDANVRLALIEAGVPVAKLGSVAKLVDAEVGADSDAIKAAVETAKTDLPEVFTASAGDEEGGDGKPKPPPSDPPVVPGKKPPAGEDAFAKGLERGKAAAGAANYPALEALNSAPR